MSAREMREKITEHEEAIHILAKEVHALKIAAVGLIAEIQEMKEAQSNEPKIITTNG